MLFVQSYIVCINASDDRNDCSDDEDDAARWTHLKACTERLRRWALNEKYPMKKRKEPKKMKFHLIATISA